METMGLSSYSCEVVVLNSKDRPVFGTILSKGYLNRATHAQEQPACGALESTLHVHTMAITWGVFLTRQFKKSDGKNLNGCNELLIFDKITLLFFGVVLQQRGVFLTRESLKLPEQAR